MIRTAGGWGATIERRSGRLRVSVQLVVIRLGMEGEGQTLPTRTAQVSQTGLIG